MKRLAYTLGALALAGTISTVALSSVATSAPTRHAVTHPEAFIGPIDRVGVLAPASTPIAAPTPAPVAPAPAVAHVATPQAVSAPAAVPAVVSEVPTATPGPQPVGPTQTLAPLPDRCMVTVTGFSTGPVTTSMSCADANAYVPPAGTTDTVTPLPASDTMTTGAAS